MGRLLAIAACLAASLVQSPASAQTSLGTELVVQGLVKPSWVAQAPGDGSRLFVLERTRGIRIVVGGAVQPGFFLDMTTELPGAVDGAVSFAFHPDYQNNGRLFVLYEDGNHRSHLAEYRVSADPDVVDPASRVQLLGPYAQQTAIHNWNCLRFGPDGMLYVSTGDDQEVIGGTPNVAQDTGSPLGKILRLDVDLPAPHVPADNPLVGVPGADQLVWLWGLRNPWRFAFDAVTWDLFIADVGNGQREEINVTTFAAAPASNFGWKCLEGNLCTGISGGCGVCSDPGYLAPVIEYPHVAGGACCVIGGEVYRGSDLTLIQGAYVYSDFCSGRIWTFEWSGGQVVNHVERTSELQPSGGPAIGSIVSFGTDNAGELYIVSFLGRIYRVIERDCSTANYCQAGQNSNGTQAILGTSGTTSVAANDLTVTVVGSMPGKVGQFFYGPNQIQNPFGGGFRCVGGQIRRLDPPTLADGSGANARALDYASQGGDFNPGWTWNFQYWYRDPQGPGGFNLSDGLQASFCP